MSLIRSTANRSFARKVYHIKTNDITKLTDNQIDSIDCGDVVIKVDETGGHSYLVSYKKAKTGICLTYTDASVVETVSYDYTEGHWVYNSTDITPLITG